MRVVLPLKETLTYHAPRYGSLAPSASRSTYHALRYASLAPSVSTIKGSPIINEIPIQEIPSNISNILLKQQPITALSFFLRQLRDHMRISGSDPKNIDKNSQCQGKPAMFFLY